MATLEVTMKISFDFFSSKFEEIEKQIKQAKDQAGLELLNKAFSAYEKELLKNRDLKVKDRRKKSYQSSLGRVSYSRVRAIDRTSQTSYPVDDWIGLKAHQKVCPSLEKAIIEKCVQLPYEKASKSVGELSGVYRSASSNWKLVQKSAEKLRKKQDVDYSKEGLPKLKPGATNPCPILSIDPDATYVRARRKSDKKHELKIAVLYSSKSPDAKSKKKLRYALNQKQILISNPDQKAPIFFNQVTQKAVESYHLNESSLVLCHGDGDPWIKQLKDHFIPQAINRLDPYHAFKKIREATGVESLPQDWVEDFYQNPKSLMNKLKALKKELAEKEDRERVSLVIQYLRNNQAGMEPSGVSPETKKKYPRMFLRGSGTIESNVDWAIGARFKRSRMNWSKKGLGNLLLLRQNFLNQRASFKAIEFDRSQYQKNYAQEVREVLRSSN